MLDKLLKSSLLRSAGTYGLANIVRQVLPVLLAPVLTRYLSPADYGTTALFGVLSSFFTPFIGVNVHGVLARRYYDRQELDFPAYVWNCLLIIAATTVLGALVLLVFGGLIASLSEFPRPWLWAVLALTSTQVINLAQLSLLQADGRPRAYGLQQVGRSMLILLLTLWFVVGLGHDWRGSIWAQVLGSTGFAVLSLYGLYAGGWLRMRWNRDYVRNALAYGGPLILHTLSGVIISVIDRFFVARYAGLAQTGIYSIGYQLGAVIGLLEDSFNRAWQPWFFALLKNGSQGDKHRVIAATYLYFVLITIGALVLGFAAPLILSILVSKSFQGAYIHVSWVAMGYAFNGMYKMVVGYLFYTGRTGVLSWLTAAAAVTNIGFNIWLVPRYGAIGAAQATTAAFFVSFVLTWIVAARSYPMPWRSPRWFTHDSAS